MVLYHTTNQRKGGERVAENPTQDQVKEAEGQESTRSIYQLLSMRGTGYGHRAKMGEGTTHLPEVQDRRGRARGYYIAGDIYHVGCLVTALFIVSGKYQNYKQFWVYDQQREHLLGIFRRVDRMMWMRFLQ